MVIPARVIGFSRFLRENGFDCDTTSVLDAVQLIDSASLCNRSVLRHTLRACFCNRPEQWHAFDELYEVFWRSTSPSDDEDPPARYNDSSAPTGTVQRNRLIGFSTSTDDQSGDQYASGAGDFRTVSMADFRFVFDADQMRVIEAMIDALARSAKRHRRHRTRAAPHGARIDFRRSYRQSLATGGIPVSLSYQRPLQRLPSFVLLLDVSQSMEVYSRLFLRFVRQLMSQFDRSDAFAFSTDLFPLAHGHTRLTEQDFENALNHYGKGWLGGTRIARSFADFNRLHLKRRVNYRTTVVVFSDGHDTDQPERLIPEIQAMQRRARRLIWVNPLAGRKAPGEPDPRMAPIVACSDAYCSGHNLVELRRLGILLLQ